MLIVQYNFNENSQPASYIVAKFPSFSVANKNFDNLKLFLISRARENCIQVWWGEMGWNGGFIISYITQKTNISTFNVIQVEGGWWSIGEEVEYTWCGLRLRLQVLNNTQVTSSWIFHQNYKLCIWLLKTVSYTRYIPRSQLCYFFCFDSKCNMTFHFRFRITKSTFLSNSINIYYECVREGKRVIPKKRVDDDEIQRHKHLP